MLDISCQTEFTKKKNIYIWGLGGCFVHNEVSHDRQEWGVARVVTRGPGAFRGPERDTFFIFSLLSVFLKERL